MLPEDFEAEALYGRDSWYVHDLITLDPDAGRVCCRVDTTRLGALVDGQIERPGHPKHVPGAVMIQITATLGNLHAAYVLGLRPSQGWVGFGATIKKARFPSIGQIGPSMEAAITARKVRRFQGKTFADYEFEYTQEGRIVYQSEQAAIWFRGLGPDHPA